ncbi:O-antigen ligase family protein [Vibrio sp. dsl-7]|uniref:O-antigen ligase family protein n=1 Tax=Vibrio chanodichtyis TaxID=3027932 RepID=A0ABT5V4H0_9VIBR|nr:O-antigen ligase family protein [Vibrio chanodichtyis]MDE1515564.1 O-antigen ligase family protein [Vibrio chanodichtyis]
MKYIIIHMKNQKKLLSYLAIILPSLPIFGNASTVFGLSILLLISIYNIIKNRTPPHPGTILIIITFLMILPLSIPHVILDSGRLAALDIPTRYLAGAIIIYGLVNNKINIEYLFAGIFLSSLISFLIYPVYMGSIHELERFKGVIFGNQTKILYIAYQSMINTAFSSFALFFFAKKNKSKLSIIAVISIVLSLTTGIMSGSKVIFLTIPVSLVLFVFTISRMKHKTKQISTVILIISTGIFLLIIPKTTVYSRAMQDISALHSEQKTSTNLRIEMIKFSWLVFKENPILGLGYTQLGEYRNKLIKENKLNLTLSKNMGKGSLHTEIGTSAATKGIIGIIIIFSLYITPIFSSLIFLKSKKINIDSHLLMCILITTFFLAGLTETLLMNTSTSSYYILILILVLLTFDKSSIKNKGV